MSKKGLIVAVKLPEIVVGSTQSVILERIGVTRKKYKKARDTAAKLNKEIMSVENTDENEIWHVKEGVEVLRVKGRANDINEKRNG